MYKIKKCDITDLNEIQRVAQKAFYDTFHAHNTEESMKEYLETAFSNNKLTEEINNPDSYFYLIQENEQAIGYLKLNFNRAQTEIKNDNCVEIERIYVLKEYHGKNIGKILLDKSIEIAKLENKEFIWLGVEDRNYRAVKFYQKNGFIEFDKHIFKFGEELQTDIMMKLVL